MGARKVGWAGDEGSELGPAGRIGTESRLPPFQSSLWPPGRDIAQAPCSCLLRPWLAFLTEMQVPWLEPRQLFWSVKSCVWGSQQKQHSSLTASTSLYCPHPPPSGSTCVGTPFWSFLQGQGVWARAPVCLALGHCPRGECTCRWGTH